MLHTCSTDGGKQPPPAFAINTSGVEESQCNTRGSPEMTPILSKVDSSLRLQVLMKGRVSCNNDYDFVKDTYVKSRDFQTRFQFQIFTQRRLEKCKRSIRSRQ